MSSFRPLAEIDSYWPPCGNGSWDGLAYKNSRRSSRTRISDSEQSVLSKTIESEIIPRLMLAHSETASSHDGEVRKPRIPDAHDVVEFVRLLLSHDYSVAHSFVTVLRARGTSLDTVFLSLFAPAARHLGELWQEDICDFTDVTIALSRLQQLLRELVPDASVEPRPGARRALLVAAPGDQHTFGIFIVQEFFRRAGWDVCGGFPDSIEELVNVARSEPFDVIGLSVSNDVPLDRLSAVIRTIRKRASNPALQIMVGGRFFLEHPEFVVRIGADATAPDGRRAVPQLSSLLDTNAMRY